MFEQAFRNIDDVLWKEAGCTTELDYTEQTSWLLFLKYLDALEQDKADRGQAGRQALQFHPGRSPIAGKAGPRRRDKDGKLDHNVALTGAILREFVNLKLFPIPAQFQAEGERAEHHRVQDRRDLRRDQKQDPERLQPARNHRHIDELRFRSQKEKHELSHLYEAKIKNMGNAGRNGGEYYTPRPLIRAMVQVVKPEARRAHLRRCLRVGGLFVRDLRLSDRQGRPSTTRPQDASGKGPSTARRRSRSPT
jgi:type I restriction enzyme M protein